MFLPNYFLTLFLHTFSNEYTDRALDQGPALDIKMPILSRKRRVVILVVPMTGYPD